MPPRYVYWTIIVDGQPTAFRSGSLEDIMPTFNRLKEKQPTAELKWFQSGQLWTSRHDAQESLRARGGRGSTRDPRPSSDAAREPVNEGDAAAAPRPERAWNAKPEWKTRSTFKPREARGSGSDVRGPRTNDKPAWVPRDKSPSLPDPGLRTPDSGSRTPDPGSRTPDPGKPDRPAGQARGSKPPEWKPKGTFKPKEAGHASGWGEKPGWKSKPSEGRSFPARDGDAFGRPSDRKPAWKPKSDDGKPAWKPKGDDGKPAWKPKGDGDRPAWKPKGDSDKPSWKPKPGGSARDQARSAFRPKSYTPKPDDGMTRSSRTQSRNDKLEWTPKGDARQGPDSRPKGPNAGFAKSDPDAPKRKWVPKAEYKKSLGIEPKKDGKWRPGGDHVDPKQKYKDAKKAKWGRVKATIRARSTKPR